MADLKLFKIKVLQFMKENIRRGEVIAVFAIVGLIILGNIGITTFAAAETIRLENPLSPSGGPLRPEELYGRIIRAFLVFVGIASLVTFVFAGTLFVASGGNAERVTKAKNAMLYAVIGMAVSIGSYVILSFVIDVLKGELL